MNITKIFILTSLLFLFTKESFCQISLGIYLEKFSNQSSFGIEKVMMNPKLLEGLGKISINGQNNLVKIKGNPIHTFAEGFQRIIATNDTNIPIIYDIRVLELKENTLENRRYSGTLRLKVAFRKKNDLSDTLLCETSTSIAYIRSESTNPSHYFEQILAKAVLKTLEYFDTWMQKNASKHESFLKETRLVFLEDVSTDKEDTLSYESRKIQWDDFKGVPNNQQYGAAIFSNFAYTSKFYIENSVLFAQIQMHTYMVRGMSWVKAEAKDDYGLAHEQLHFDITKWVVERFKKKIQLLAKQIQSMDDLNSRIQYEYLESYREMNALQKQYDSETLHSINRQEQMFWNEKVRKELKSNE